MAPGAKFSTMTSARFAMPLTSSSPRSDFRVAVWGRGAPRRAPEQIAAGSPALGFLHLDDLGAEPGERLRAGGASLELGQVQDTNAVKTAQRHAVGRHFLVPPDRARLPALPR